MVVWALSSDVKILTNLPNSFMKDSPKRPPCAMAPASESARSPNFGSTLMRRERRRSVDRAQLASLKQIMGLWAHPDKVSREIKEPDSLVSSAISKIFCYGA